MSGERVQVNVYMARQFVKLVDRTAELTGSTRSDFVRRAIEHYIQELRQSNLTADLSGDARSSHAGCD